MKRTICSIVAVLASTASGGVLSSKRCPKLSYTETQSVPIPGLARPVFTLRAQDQQLLYSDEDQLGVMKRVGATFEPLVPIGPLKKFGMGYGESAFVDLDGDHKPDFVWADYSTDLRILWGKGGTKFSNVNEPQELDVPRSANLIGVLAYDLDGDGNVDLISAGDANRPAGATVFWNHGKRRFSKAMMLSTEFPTGDKTKDGSDTVSNIAIADVNGDGKPDVVIVGEWTVQVFLNEGHQRFAAKPKWTKRNHEGTNPRQIALADFDGDRKLDVAIVDTKVVEILTGNGDGTFDATRDISIDPEDDQFRFSGATFAIGDINGDGKPDIVYSAQGQRSPSTGNVGAVTFYDGFGVLIGKGDGTFEKPQTFTAPVRERQSGPIVLEDINGDGVLDVITIGADHDNDNTNKTFSRLSVWTSACSK